MELITQSLTQPSSKTLKVKLFVDRFKLAKRRWRGQAEDGSDFGFNLEGPLEHDACFFQNESHSYWIAQSLEKVLEVDYSEDPETACRVAWAIGNLHMALQIVGLTIRVADDPAIRQLFTHLQILHTEKRARFQPIRVSNKIKSKPHSHGKGHPSHDH